MSHKVAAIQMVTGASVQQNLEVVEQLVNEAASAGASLVLLPENFAVLDGGPLREFGEREGDPTALLQSFLSKQSKKHRIFLVAGTLPLITRPRIRPGSKDVLIDDGRVRAASLVFDSNGDIVARYDKIHLFDVEVDDKQARYLESRSYEGGEQVASLDTPVGRLGLSVCYDLRFPELYRRLASEAVDLITVPSAFTKSTGAAHWEVLLRSRAIENQCYILAANQGGVHNATRETYGNSMIVDPWGTVLDRLGEGPGVVLATIDHEFIKEVRRKMPIEQHRRI
ncbi:MAG: carbon-nitrogen hydrolase family protein [Pseudohongiellaceae bacterium]